MDWMKNRLRLGAGLARCAPAWAVAICLNVAQAQSTPPPDTLAQRLQACTACHGAQGRATNQGYFPRIAGKPAGYLYNQLVNFQQGRRSNAAMTYLVDHLSEAYLQEIAGHFGALALPYPAPQPASAPPAVLARGRALALQGDATRRLPACLQCHGERLTGAMPAFPGLLGLSRDYLLAQFGAWRSGQRRAASPDCMAEITRRLSADDVAAVASWLAAQPLPADTHPAASAATPLPMDCGSGPT
ncbi:MAG: c-type cytochrome [Aquabacterium sp.]